MAGASWYVDPLDPARGRYWDGSRWSDHTTPIPPGESLPAFPAALPSTSVAPAVPEPPPGWGMASMPIRSPGPSLPPPPTGVAPYTAYTPYLTPPRQRSRGSMVAISGGFSVLIGGLLIAYDLSIHNNGISILIGGLIMLRGIFWIGRGLR